MSKFKRLMNLLGECFTTFVLMTFCFVAVIVIIYQIYSLYTGITGNFVPVEREDTSVRRIVSSLSLLFVMGLLLYMLVPVLRENMFPKCRQAFMAYRLIGNNGVKTWATVIDTAQTGLYVNRLPEFRFSLEYSVPGYEKKFIGNLTKVLGYGSLDYVHTNSVEILYDPKDPKKISWVGITR